MNTDLVRGIAVLVAIAGVTTASFALPRGPADESAAPAAAASEPSAGRPPPSASAVSAVSAVSAETVCFDATVRGPGVERPITIVGTRFTGPGFSSSTTSIVLLHGGAMDRSVWDVDVGGEPSPARALAAAGYALFAIDRPGNGESNYAGPAGDLTPDAQAGVVRDVVSLIRSGSYRVTADACPAETKAPFGTARVVVAGHSFGAGIAQLYAVTYHPADGLISMGWSNHGLSTGITERLLVRCMLPQVAQNKEYLDFCPGPNGYSETCIYLAFHRPGAAEGDPERLCANDALGRSPAGEVRGIGKAFLSNLAGIPAVGDIPVILQFSEFDSFFAGDGAEDSQGREEAYWRGNCGCRLSVFTQPDAGHVWMYHTRHPETTAAIVAWLAASGFAATP